ncbi:acetylcholinesterase-like [Gigantopelta aegis]|uniref:acetylcholinesterase-like n=1 Tax=Gigantopelta aegis TaxID=1735272 RepID=UPI001B88A44D|nr:acetylcholinesterase-like [Gigantopelta aegis]
MDLHLKSEIRLLLCLILLYSVVSDSKRYDAYVVVKAGALRGKVTGHPPESPTMELQEFLGVPYASPPTGNRRFANPEPLESWEGTHDARRYGPSCHQRIEKPKDGFSGITMWNPPNQMDEDCLNLNIWTTQPRPQKAAVMVWIHGGAYETGTSALSIYDGKTLVGLNDIILVSINYRLGAFGFLATGDGRISGNFGAMDQIMALKWIKDNIAAFGGNPDSVTIFGESAGGTSIDYLMLSPLRGSLFTRAILQSAASDSPLFYMRPEQAKKRSAIFFQRLNCTNDNRILNCLRQSRVSPRQIIESQKVVSDFAFSWVPTVAKPFLPEKPDVLRNSVPYNKTRVLLGVTKDEATYLLLNFTTSFSRDNTSNEQTAQDVRKIISVMNPDLSGDRRQAIYRHYMRGGSGDVKDLIRNRKISSDIVGDRYFVCPAVRLSDRIARAGQDVFLYYFAHRPVSEVWPSWMGAYHSIEIQFVFGLPVTFPDRYSNDDVMLSRRVMTYWTNFARFGNPNDPELLEWPQYDEDTMSYMELNLACTVHTGGLRNDQCTFWNQLRTSSSGSRFKSVCILGNVVTMLLYLFITQSIIKMY